MRFLKHSPAIPDDLLFARDEGRVIFFCGAGVSRARAGLPDFFGLAYGVISKLGVQINHPAYKILNEAREMEARTGVGGLISADRVFGLLERDFLVRDIEAAVARALQPAKNVDLTAHQILLNLATTPEGKVRLVTTNFDRLFENCSEALQIWQPPRLPDPSRHKELDGIIHLHGCVTEGYDGADGDGFILSSSEFGRAYLSDGWATDFFKEILDRYIVVFVGYAADDPPVLYLLEALNKRTGRLDGVYAFQSGLENEAAGRWLHKGVEAIPYSENEGHRALWETLSAWAERAKAPDKWFKSVIDLAQKGPEVLEPHERGQVAHIISRVEGARKFSEADPPPPAEWLCVFDPRRRYATPGHSWKFYEKGPYVDPFGLYGLDGDTVPQLMAPDEHYKKRDIPTTAWDGFAANRLDRQNLGEHNLSALRGYWAVNIPNLPSRLAQLGEWIRKIADQPASVWWAARQPGLHPVIKQRILWELAHSPKNISPNIRRAWRYLFEAWEGNQGEFGRDLYDLKAVIDKDGWNSAVIRAYAAINRPYLKASSNYSGAPRPPEREEDISIGHMVQLEVEYPDQEHDVNIPDEWLAFAVRELRKNLEHALHLETELGGYRLINISPIIPDDEQQDGDRYMRTKGLSGSVILFSSLFERLVTLDVTSAKHEFEAWPTNDDTIFTRLKIWASGMNDLVSAGTFGPIIVRLSDSAFWSSYHQRDLLLVLAKRWGELGEQTRKEIEDRLLRGPVKWDGEEDDKFESRRASASLNRLSWLANSGCEFTFDWEEKNQKLRSIAPEWKPEYAAMAAESLEGRVGFVRTETEHSALLNEPIGNILARALEFSGRDDFLVQKNPFAGLSAERPVQAFAVLTNTAKRDDYPEWAWQTFLNAEARKNDKPRFSALIAERISRYPNRAVAEFIRPACNWISNISEHLASDFPQTFDRVLSKLIDVLRLQPPASISSIVRGSKQPDWALEALNAPVGRIAQTLFDHPKMNGLEAGKGFPAEWIIYVNDLLSLNGDLRRHALVIFAHNMSWFYAIDPQWAEANLLSVLGNGDEQDRNAIWSGFLWRAAVPDQKLYMRLKPTLLTFAKQRSLPRHGYDNVLSGMILAGWGSTHEKTGERLISNAEMHDVLLHADDEFRSQILWRAKSWSESNGERAGERWVVRIPELIRDAWPRQKSVKSPTISAQLCKLAFSNAKGFPDITEVILPLLTTIDRNQLMLHGLLDSNENIVDMYPQQTLAILHAVLPDNVASWPYGIQAILHRIGEVDNSLTRDERLLELNRKWNSR
jgi:hypothetical protein